MSGILPYWFTPPAKGNTTNLWHPTLGADQYQWLKTTLETSDANVYITDNAELFGDLVAGSSEPSCTATRIEVPAPT